MHTLQEILTEPQNMSKGGDPDESVTAGDVVSTTPDSPETLASFFPIVGDVLDIKEFYEAATKEGGPDYAGMGIAALGLVPFVGDVAQAGIRGARAAFKTIDEVPKAKLVDETLSAEELPKKVSVKTGDFAAPRKPELQKAVTKLETGEITGKQYRQLVKKELPINPITEVPKLDSFEQISAALTKDKRARGLVGFNRNIKQGARVLSRLDIPAYNKHDTWVVTLTDKSQNVRTMYSKTAVLKNVKFSPHTTPSLKVAKGKAKEPFATMEGDWQNISPEDARKYVIDNKILEKSLDPNNKEWVQVGFNPERHGFFYTKSGEEIGQPIFDAEEIIQIGGLVLARNIKKPNLTQLKKLKIKGVSRVFNKGGQVRPMYDGGLVLSMQDGGFVVETYVNPETRSEMKIPHMGNVPSWPVPPGFMLKSEITDQLIAADPPAPGGLEAVEGDEIGDIPGWDKDPVDHAIDDLNAQLERGEDIDLTGPMSKHGVTQSQIHSRVAQTQTLLSVLPSVITANPVLKLAWAFMTNFLTPGLTPDMVGMGVTSEGPGGDHGLGLDPGHAAGDPGKGFDDWSDTPADEVGAGPHGTYSGTPNTPTNPTDNYKSWNPVDPVGDTAADTGPGDPGDMGHGPGTGDPGADPWARGGLVRLMYDGGLVSMQDGGDPEGDPRVPSLPIEGEDVPSVASVVGKGIKKIPVLGTALSVLDPTPVADATLTGNLKEVYHLTTVPEITGGKLNVIPTEAASSKGIDFKSDIGVHVTTKKGVENYKELLKKLPGHPAHKKESNVFSFMAKIDNTIEIPDIGSFKSPESWIRNLTEKGGMSPDRLDITSELIDKEYFIDVKDPKIRQMFSSKLYPSKSAIENLKSSVDGDEEQAVRLWKYLVEGSIKHSVLKPDTERWVEFLQDFLDRTGADAFSYTNTKETGGERSFMILNQDKLLTSPMKLLYDGGLV